MHAVRDIEKTGFATMAVGNLHIRNKYICQWFQVMFILNTDPENIGMDTICVTVSCILSTILNAIDFSIMEALICIKKIPQGYRSNNPTRIRQ